MLTFESFNREPLELEVTVHSYQGVVLIQPPSLSEYLDEALAVEQPKPPIRVINGVEKPDTQDDEYLAALSEANQRRKVVHVMSALMRAGNFPDLKDKPLDEVIDEAMASIPRDFIEAVYFVLNEHIARIRDAVKVRRGKFRGRAGQSNNAGEAALSPNT